MEYSGMFSRQTRKEDFEDILQASPPLPCAPPHSLAHPQEETVCMLAPEYLFGIFTDTDPR